MKYSYFSNNLNNIVIKIIEIASLVVKISDNSHIWYRISEKAEFIKTAKKRQIAVSIK